MHYELSHYSKKQCVRHLLSCLQSERVAGPGPEANRILCETIPQQLKYTLDLDGPQRIPSL